MTIRNEVSSDAEFYMSEIMAIVLFFILFLIEIAFAVFTLKKQKSQKEWIRNRLVVNAFELLVFVGMTLFPGIDFSFRFKVLFWLIVIRIVISGIRFLLKYKKAESTVKTSKIVTGSVFIIIAIFFGMMPSFIFADYKGMPTSGNYDVAISHVILTDNSRAETFENDGSNREVPIYIFYPENALTGETFPLVLFSHGAFGYYQSNYSTFMELASNGYVVVSIEHPYHSIFTTDTSGKTIIADKKFLSDAMTIGSSEDYKGLIFKKERFDISSEWMKLRIADMNFAIDTIKSACQKKSLPYDIWALRGVEKNPAPTESKMLDILSLADFTKIGLMGHSMGGATSVTVGRNRDDISAVIDIDGTMLGEELAFENGNIIVNQEPYPIPLLVFDNTETAIENRDYDGYANNVILKNALNAQNTYIKNSGHMNFTDLPLFSPALASLLGTGKIDANHCIEIVNRVILEFMNSNLKGDGSYKVQEFYE